MWIGWQGPLGLLVLLHYCTVAWTCRAVRTLALLYYGTIARTCWASRTMALGPVGQLTPWQTGCQPPHHLCKHSARELCSPNLPKFTKRGEKLKTGAQPTETSTQHGTTEVVSKRAPGVGSVVLEEHLEGSSPCRLKSRPAPNLPH